VGASENITFMFSCLMRVREWVICLSQVITGNVHQQEEQDDDNKGTSKQQL
jgi:hypothetical protein